MTSPFPIVPMCLGVMGLGFTVLLCTIICMVYSRRRERKRERAREQERVREQERAREWESETWRSSEQDWQPPSIYFVHFSRTMSLPDEDYSQEPSAPPRYSSAIHCETPPAYNEVACKPDDLPPPYTLYNIPVCPVSPPSYTDKRQSHKGRVKHVTFNV